MFGFDSVWLGFDSVFFLLGSILARFFSGLAQFFSGIFSVWVWFGFFGFRLIKPKPNQTGLFF
jgi:hypothetical protein